MQKIVFFTKILFYSINFHTTWLPNLAVCKIGLKVLSKGTKVGQDWYQSNRKDKMYCRQMSFSMPQGTPSREYHKCTWRL
jgi:hypothetical protein